ncbi:VWA domain-containing protein [Marinobacter sp. SS21]|uniref:VWA domain-containing protein n=1 Tax=Marinobacter sp. SS21 TaxID=2979460 RepID=UPI00232F009E|nr:VWA domain-containing protein [Marinobacter sp. SS21]MDC0662125.1 VWA domain-containing protein [Marinobacter sp. SS21]
MADLHFLRPGWLLLLLVIPLLPLLWRYRITSDSGWHRIIPAHLLAPLLSRAGNGQARERKPWLLPALLLIVLALALAGPAWREAPTPLQQQNDSLVIVLDLSLSMLATDVQPDRLTQAKRKIRDILAVRRASLTALVVYAAEGHVVTPLTDDQRTIEGMLEALDPLVMPAAGNRADLGIAQAVSLLQHGAPGAGRMVLITDDVAPRYRDNILRQLADVPYPLHTLVVGTESGGPIPLARRGFIRDQGDIVVTRANPDALRQLASAAGGLSQPLSLDGRDIQALQLSSVDRDDWQQSERELTVERWQDDGYWLLWAVLPLLLLGWRRGAVLMLVATVTLPTLPRTALAIDWESLWARPDQRGEALIAEDPGQAATRFSDPEWRGSALYRAEDYQGAADAFAHSDSTTAAYNRANALARAGDLQAALAGYDAVLEQAPDHEDARANRELVQQLLDQQNQQADSGENQQDPQNGEGEQPPSGNDRNQAPPSDEPDDPSDQGDRGSQPPDGSGGGEADDSPSDRGDQEPDTSPEQPQNAEADSPNASDEGSDAPSDPQPAPLSELDTAPLSQGQEQWLRRVPDDPGGLLRRKFLHQYQNRAPQSDESDTPW